MGQANNTTINGGRQTIHDGGISTGTIIDSGNQDVLYRWYQQWNDN
ncbi:putative ATP-binding component of a transport system [Escherichia coli ISC7]|uniref:ATP-binding component of a transport system n=1 Tax=Escherichia coli ISC7 TaxID=1432555 RepID=W1F9F0_ECOLX|nr:putative ATP-binding component of a transport system [Escherichia coli ISC7]